MNITQSYPVVLYLSNRESLQRCVAMVSGSTQLSTFSQMSISGLVHCVALTLMVG